MLLRPRRRAQTVLLVLAALASAGCAELLGPRASPEAAAERERAARFEDQGQWADAAEAWLAASRFAIEPEADLIEAAEAWLRAGDPTRARQAFDALPEEGAAGLAPRRTLLAAELALRTGDAEAARTLLAGVDLPPGDPETARLLALKGEAAFAAGQAAEGVEWLVAREGLLTEPDRRRDNQRRIWNRLQEAAAAGHELSTPPGADPVVAGWLALGREAAAGRDSPYRLRATLSAWQEANPAHPAATGVVSELLAEYRAMTDYPQQVGLLLPLSGRQASAAGAVRDGVIAGYIAHPPEERRPTLRVYDTVALGTTMAWEQAVREGAEFIVGPLLKEEIAELAGAELLPVPALVLNWADDGVFVPAHLVQFALAPEDEAAAAARRVVADDRTRGVALVPDTDQGRRMAQSFALELQRLGGVLLDWQMYDPAAKDFSAEIGRLLLLDESRARHQKLQSILGRRLEYEPHRRSDAEFLFLAARAPEGRLLRPQLRYHFAGDLPVYATSLIYEPGHPANPDLDGVLFDDMPWRTGSDGEALTFMEHFDTFGRDAVDRMGHLYAFGVDAWRLLPLVHNRSGRLASGIEGLTGTLSLDESGRVRRDLSWARIRQGRPQPLPPAHGETVGAGPAE